MAGYNDRSKDFVQTAQRASIKQYIVYDGSNRMQFVYEAPIYANNGDPCMVTQYAYYGSSNRISNMKESEGVWSSSYDF